MLPLWRGPDWDEVADAFTVVEWWWIAVAIALNVLSVCARCSRGMSSSRRRCRRRTRASATRSRRFPSACSQTCPARADRRARPRRRPGAAPPRRAADLGISDRDSVRPPPLRPLPAALLLVYVLQTAKIPHWAATSLYLFVGIGATLFALAMASAKTHHRVGFAEDADRRVHQLVTMARAGLGVLRAPLPAVGAALLQMLGWAFQLAAIYVAMRAFGIHESLPPRRCARADERGDGLPSGPATSGSYRRPSRCRWCPTASRRPAGSRSGSGSRRSTWRSAWATCSRWGARRDVRDAQTDAGPRRGGRSRSWRPTSRKR